MCALSVSRVEIFIAPYTIGRCTSLFRGAAQKNTRVATRMRRGWRSSTKDRFHARTQAGVPVSLDEAFNRRSFHLTKRCQERFWVLMRTQSLDQPEWIRPPKPGTRWPSNTDSSASQAVQRSLSERTSRAKNFSLAQTFS